MSELQKIMQRREALNDDEKSNSVIPGPEVPRMRIESSIPSRIGLQKKMRIASSFPVRRMRDDSSLPLEIESQPVKRMAIEPTQHVKEFQTRMLSISSMSSLEKEINNIDSQSQDNDIYSNIEKDLDICYVCYNHMSSKAKSCFGELKPFTFEQRGFLPKDIICDICSKTGDSPGFNVFEETVKWSSRK
jgi:hypothetical protein